MRAAKGIGLGIFFSFVGFVMLLVISIMRGPVSFETSQTSHATGLSAVVGGIIEALFNPISLLVIVVAFIAVTWLRGRLPSALPHFEHTGSRLTCRRTNNATIT